MKEVIREFDLRCSSCLQNEEGEYRLHVSCSNCGAIGIGIYSRTHRARTNTCAVCGTTSMSPINPRKLVV